MRSHWTQNDLLVNGVQLHYYRTGHGKKRPLVLVHGFSDNGLCWTQTARDLETEYDVIMPDMRGHGLSARVQPGENVDMAADLAEIIRALELKRPIICGHSMGATVTYQIGVRFPDLASALVLEDPAWWISRPFPASSPDQPTENPIATWAKNLSNQTLEELLVQYRQDNPNWSEEFIQIMCQSKKQLDPQIIDVMTAKMHSEEWSWLTTLQNVTHPMLLFAGNPELGGIVTPEVTAKVHELNPDVTIVNIPDVGHLIRFDNHVAFMNGLRPFLKQVSS